MPMQIQSDGYDKIYCYPGTNVLKNKLNIMDSKNLHTVERRITSKVLAILINKPEKGNFDFKHLQAIHRSIFGDVYEWAGKVRAVDIAKGNLFCRVSNIESFADDIFKKLQKDNYLIGCAESSIPGKLAYYLGELNALHPFREGNGRSQREFVRSLAAVAGYDLNLTRNSGKEMLEASIDSFNLKYDKMEALIKKNISRLSYKEQLSMCKSIFVNDKLYMPYFKYVSRICTNIEKSGFVPKDKVVRKLEELNQKAGKELSVRDIKQIVKAGEGEELFSLAKDLTKEFAKQERGMIQVPEP